MRKILSSTLAVTVLLGAAATCFAQSASKPLVTVSMAGYDKLLADLGVLGELGGAPNFGKQLEMMSMMLPQGGAAKGPLALDTKHPWGAVAFSDGRATNSYAFLPLADLKPLMDLVKVQLGHEIEVTDGVYKIPLSGQTVYATQKGDWAFLTDSREQLDKVAADPLPLLDDLPKRYDLAIRASVKNLPKEYRGQLLAQLRAGAEVGMQQMPSESEEDYALRLGVAKQTIQQLTSLVDDMDTLLLGWNVDPKAKCTYLDLELTAQTGTKLAEQFARVKPVATNFAGLAAPGAALSARWTGTLSDAEVAQARSGLAVLRKSLTKELEKQGLTEEQVKLASRLLGDGIDVLEKTVESKKTDSGLSLLLDPAAATLVAGAAIADGDKLEKSVQQLLDAVEKSGQFAGSVEVKAETYQGVHLHIISAPTPDPALSPLVGDRLVGVVGIAGDKVLVAAGRDAVKTLRQAIDRLKTTTGKEVPPLEIAVAAGPIAKFLAEMGTDPQVKATATMLAGMLEKAGGKDHIVITAQPSALGVRFRLQPEEGLLKALGSLGQTMSGMVPGGGF